MSHGSELEGQAQNKLSQADANWSRTLRAQGPPQICSAPGHYGQWLAGALRSPVGWGRCALAQAPELLPDHPWPSTRQRLPQTGAAQSNRVPVNLNELKVDSNCSLWVPTPHSSFTCILTIVLILGSTCFFSIYPRLLNWIISSVRTETVSCTSLGSFSHLAHAEHRAST